MSALLVPARVSLFPLRLLCLYLLKIVRFLCICSACACQSSPTSFASTFLVHAGVRPLPLCLLYLCLPKFIRFFCVCSAFTWSSCAFFASALPVLARIYLLPLRLLHLCLEFVYFLFVCAACACAWFIYCLCPRFFLIVSALLVYFLKFYNISFNQKHLCWV